jgi:hypothetical protein
MRIGVFHELPLNKSLFWKRMGLSLTVYKDQSVLSMSFHGTKYCFGRGWMELRRGIP